MKKYDKYKDSGIEWIGEIPEHWNVDKLGWQGYFSASGIDKKDVPGEPMVKMINYTDIYGNTSKTLTSEREYMIVSCPDGKKQNHQVKKGDLIFTPSSETAEDIGLSALVTEELLDTVFSYHVIRLEFKKEFDLSFKKYLCNNNFVLNQFSREAKGTTRQIIGRDVFKKIEIVIPPLDEQTAIATYLDRKTSEFDELIQQKEKLLQLYEEEKTAIINHAVTKGINPNVKLKDSRIEWLGDIPEHWEIKKIKLVCKIQGRIGFKGYKTSDLVLDGNGAITLGATHITKLNKIDLSEPIYLNWDKYYESPEIMVKEGDIVFTQRGAYLGKVGYIDKNYGEVTINPSLILLKNIQISAPFLAYYLTSNYIRQNVEVISNSTAIPMISQEQLANFYCVLPPLAEQYLISKFIDEKILVSENVTEKLKKQIELLKQYKTALISEVATGKVKVNEK
jgi:type I restriction enzyme S subunit